MNKPMSICIFLMEGTPKGIRTAEIGGWTGIALVCPRSKINEFKKFEYASQPAVYLLIGDEDGGQSTVYIGETETAIDRIFQHAKDATKDFWNYVVAFVSKDKNMTKAHVAYLEARLIQLAKTAGRAKVQNTNANLSAKGLPAPDRAVMNHFIENMQILLPALGMTVLETVTTNLGQKNGPVFELHSKTAYATATEVDGDFIVFNGSTSRGQTRQTDSYRSLRTTLTENGVLVKNENTGLYAFTKDYAFSSPTAASAIIVGGNDNGRTSWKLKGTEQTYADWQAASLNGFTAPK